MANKIDLTKTEAAQLANADLDYLKANGARALPNSPSASGWSAEAIKKQLYKQPEILFAWLKRLAESQLDLGGKINDYLDDIGSGGEFPLVFDTLANAQAAVSAGEVKAGSIVFVSNGSDIKAYYCGDGGLVSLGGDLVHKSGAETITGKKTFTGGASFTAGNVNFGSSGSDNSKQLDIYYTINLRGPVTSNTIIPGNTFALGSAEHYWGSAYIDDLFLYGVISDGMYEWSLPSKNGTIVLDSDITKSALETILGAASSSSNGYMSSSDKAHLDALYALLGSESDADSVVNTINEVLSVFNQYPEGVELSLVLAGKVGYSDIYDALDSTATNKALSANQGKALNDRLTTAEGSVSDHGTRLTTAEGDIDDLETEIAKKITKGAGVFDNTMGAGYADVAKSLQTSVGRADETPFGFQTTGGSADVETGIQQLRKLVGVSVVRNQLNDDPTMEHSDYYDTNGYGTKSVASNELTFTMGSSENAAVLYKKSGHAISFVKGHTYLLAVYAKASNPSSSCKVLQVYNGSAWNTPPEVLSSSYAFYSVIITFASDVTNTSYLRPIQINLSGSSIGDTVTIKNFVVIDLTQRYGNNTVVNAIIGNDSSTQVTKLLQFDPSILKQTAYDAGTLVDSQSAKLKSVGYNQWDEQWESGHIDAQTGNPIAYAGKIRSKNFIRVTGGEKYGFIVGSSGGLNVYMYDINKNYIPAGTTAVVELYGNGTYTFPANIAYIRISTFGTGTTTYNHDICVFIYWDGSRTGYEPYESQTYDLPNIVQRGILKVDGSGNIYADGDVAYPDGTGETRYGIVDLGTLDWTYDSEHVLFHADSPADSAPVVSNSSIGIICGKYSQSTSWLMYNSPSDKTVVMNGGYWTAGKKTLVHDSAYTDAASFKTAMSGVYLIYELATPVESESTPFPENVWADDFGTMQFLDSDGNEIVGLQGAEFFYQANIAGFAESIYAREDIDGDPAQLVSHTELDARTDDIPTTDGAYVMTASVSSGNATPSWEECGVIEIATEIDTDKRYNTDAPMVLTSAEKAAMDKVASLLRKGLTPQIQFTNCKNSYNSSMLLYASSLHLRRASDSGDKNDFFFVLYPYKQYSVERQLKLYQYYAYNGTIKPTAYIDNMSN